MGEFVDVPPPRLLERFSHLETDIFCDCGYNLHGQRVTRDERLHFMVCRCPECGRWHPAGHATAARTLWLGRLATFTVVSWMLLLIGFFIGTAALLGSWQREMVSKTTRFANVTPDGKLITYVYDAVRGSRPVVLETGEPATDIRYRRIPNPRPLGMLFTRDNIVDVAGIALAAFAAGAVGAVGTWHIRRRYMALWLLLPFCVAAFMLAGLLVLERDKNDLVIAWAAKILAACAAAQCVPMAIGLWLGRPLTRLLAIVFIPPTARHALAFLWRTDGLNPPPARHPSLIPTENAG